MKKLLLTICLAPFLIVGQEDYFEQWDKNYAEVNVLSMLESEELYADSVGRNPEIPNFFSRFDVCRFNAIYTGKKRKLQDGSKEAMTVTSSLFGKDIEQILAITKNEVLMRVGDREIWMPIQSKLEKPLKEEIGEGGKVHLYCAFFNYHSEQRELYNIFLISEFRNP